MMAKENDLQILNKVDSHADARSDSGMQDDKADRLRDDKNLVAKSIPEPGQSNPALPPLAASTSLDEAVDYLLPLRWYAEIRT